ncbi:MAG: fumarylacetoacetate hydrolase family protein [Bacteroidota bacterium]
MKLATVHNGTRDGKLVVVNRALTAYVSAPANIPTMQHALDDWANSSKVLQQLYEDLEAGKGSSEPLDVEKVMAPLPRAYQWLDGSAFLNHVRLVRKSRGVEMPPEFLTDPLMYQGGSDTMLGPRDNIEVLDLAHGCDLEAEVVVICNDLHKNPTVKEAGDAIIMIGIINDVSLRGIIPSELKKGFGFVHGKPPTAFSPVFATLDELGDQWKDYKVQLPMRSWINGEWFGNPNCGVEMQFSFAELVAHAARTRPLKAGTIIGSGTISNSDASQGFSCLSEKRMIEIIETGQATTSYLSYGDQIKIDMLDTDGNSIFGSIEQTVTQG